MASSPDNVKDKSEYCIEYLRVPVRHMKILNILARCKYCGRLLCCIEHCLKHEIKNHQSERERKGLFNPETYEWNNASEMNLSSPLVQKDFPYLCVHCNIEVKDEIYLRRLITLSSPCPVKNRHWMIPLKKYKKLINEEENKENSMGGNNGKNVFRCSPFVKKKTPERSLLRTALRNCLNISLQTPPPTNFKKTTNVAGPLTSTPESDTVSCSSLGTDVSPTTPEQLHSPIDQPLKERASILSTGQRTRTRPTGITRRVTFACEPESDNEINDESANERQNADFRNVSDEKKNDVKCECKSFNDEGNKENIPLKHKERDIK